MNAYVIIGGGLAGLTAANALAGRGHRVTLLEQSAHPGGRARTQIENGYSLNFGPHALYRGGRAAQTFHDWKIPIQGGLPPTSSRAFFVRDAQFHLMVVNLRGLLATRLFHFREKLEVANLLRLFAAARAHPGETMAEWLDRHVLSPRVREFATTAIRIATFAIELDYLDAAAALGQLASGLKHNVLYLDHGWQTLVDGLTQRARSLGVAIRCGEPVRNLDSIDATGIVLAVGPGEVEKITGVPMPVRRPLRMATLDLGLDGAPSDAANVAFPLDRPLYFAAHSASAKLAPDGGRLVHIAKYLGSTAPDATPIRAELEAFATLVMPKWREHAKVVRFLPDLTVTPMMPSTPKRPTVDYLAQKVSRVMIAGDWVGTEGILADAAVASALEAARTIQQREARAA